MELGAFFFSRRVDGGTATGEREKPSFDAEPEPKKAAPREEAAIGTIEKGSKWH